MRITRPLKPIIFDFGAAEQLHDDNYFLTPLVQYILNSHAKNLSKS
jgi:hypothetical protein